MIFKVQEIRFTDVDYLAGLRSLDATVTLVYSNACVSDSATLTMRISDKNELKKYTDAYFNKTDIIVDIKI